MNNNNQAKEFDGIITPIYTQTEDCYGRFSEKGGQISDFAIDEAAIALSEDKDKLTLAFGDPEVGLLIEMKTKDFLYLSRLLEKYLELLEKPDGE
jgi:hypothetical protein